MKTFPCLRDGLLLVSALHLASLPAMAQSWSPTGASSNSWAAIACSADGAKLVAATGGLSVNGQLYTSSNAGSNWTVTAAPLLHWCSVDSSADGTNLVATAYGNGLYTSTDSGVTWISNRLGGGNWISAACSADGSTFAAVRYLGSVYRSTNSGASWVTNNTSVADLVSIATSADGMRLAAGNNVGRVLISTNGGASWPGTNNIGGFVSELAASADFHTLISTVEPSPAVAAGLVISSLNSGRTWVTNSLPASNFWYAVATSADGTRFVAAAGKGRLSTSADAGATWVSNDVPALHWTAVASSSDGTVLYAAASNGGIWSSRITPNPLLRIAQDGNSLGLSWIVPSASFGLQETPIVTPATWTDMTNLPVLNFSNLNYEVTLPFAPQPIFYRLKAR